MNIIKWDPFRELEEASTRLNHFLGALPGWRPAGEDAAFFAAWAPPIDIEETEKEYLVKVDLPEVKKEEVKVAVDEGVLTVEGERKLEKEEKGRLFHRTERAYGKFVRRVALPMDVNEKASAAEFQEGVLRVHLPKSMNGNLGAIEVKVA